MKRNLCLAVLCMLGPVLQAEEAAPAAIAPTNLPAVQTLDTINASIQKGLDWLIAHQAENGSWSNPRFPALTALGLWAFAGSDHPGKQAACERAAAYVAGCIQEDGGIYLPATEGRGSGGLSTYNTAICMIALHQYDPARFARPLINARAFVAKSQLKGDSPAAGGFGYEQNPPPGRPLMADLSNTGWAMQAMRATEPLKDRIQPGESWADLDWTSALAFIEKLQISDPSDPQENGGFTYNTGGDRAPRKSGGPDDPVKLCGFGSMTYAGIESMIYAELTARDARVQSALAWAARHWSVTENPGMGGKGLFYYYTIMSKALNTSQCTMLPAAGQPIDWRGELAVQLHTTQQPDGSWINTDNTFWESDPALVTAYAVLCLQNCRTGN